MSVNNALCRFIAHLKLSGTQMSHRALLNIKLKATRLFIRLNITAADSYDLAIKIQSKYAYFNTIFMFSKGSILANKDLLAMA